MSDKKSVTVHIYGNEYTLKGDADPNYIADLAKYVDGKMNDIGKKSSAPAAKVAILASMNIADEYHRADRAREEAQKLLEVAERNLLEMRKASEGSLKHSMELKQNLEKTTVETADARRTVEDRQREVAALKAELEKAAKESDENRQVAEEALAEIDNARKDAGTKIQVKEQELEKVRQEFKTIQEIASKKYQALAQELEKARQALVDARKEADAAKRQARERAEVEDQSGPRNAGLEKQLEASTAEIRDLKAQVGELQDKLSGRKVESQKLVQDKRIQDLEAAAAAAKDQADLTRKESLNLKAELDKAFGEVRAAQAELQAARETPISVEAPQLSFLPPPDQLDNLLRRIDQVLEVR
jgi:cell division protein ZapA